MGTVFEASYEELKAKEAENERLRAVILMAMTELENEDVSGAYLTLKCSLSER